MLFLSALGEIEDRVTGLKAGGDDYLVKPFAFGELAARVEALARRPVLREEAEPAAVEEIDVEPQLPPPPRWMLMMGGAAIAALMGALLGGFMHI